ncbi:hypothetical protein BN2476_360043 [Paraburkholderia piptadeniae]|uniref:Uncharacterized protein n=1 Tax=Paraburkholderia piptadeniae TaxID=1701573 RepID=A0A1N7S9B2_9BURK|nr:hypothetical protein BN2476_360043 [Paraburkholderia piptadeniae]
MHRHHVPKSGNVAGTFTLGNGTQHQQQTSESLLTLAEYLELALDMGGSLIMMRRKVLALCDVHRRPLWLVQRLAQRWDDLGIIG